MGVHVSKVKSVNLDTWTAEQVAVSVCGWIAEHFDNYIKNYLFFKLAFYSTIAGKMSQLTSQNRLANMQNLMAK